jgi:two-component system sensor kinase FixL
VSNQAIAAVNRRGNVAQGPRRDWRLPAALVATGAIYYLGARVGMALTFEPFPLSVLWPPNALLFAALVVAPTRWWWAMLLAALPGHLLAELQAGVPVAMVLGWFVSNLSEALIGALIVRRFAGTAPLFSTLRGVIVFCIAATSATVVSCFLDSSLVRLIGWRTADFWTLWQVRLFSNVLATLTFVPVVVACAALRPAQLTSIGRGRLLEASALVAGLLAVSILVFDSPPLFGHDFLPSLLYLLPLPFLVWAALRFGPPLTSACFMIVAFLVIWGAGHGLGPFVEAARHDNALPIQLFLICTAVPLLLLVAVLEERKRAEQMLRNSEELFATAFRSSPDAIALSRRSDGRILAANDRWLELLDYDREERARVAPLTAHADDADRTRLAALMRDGSNARDVEVTLRDCRGNSRNTLVSIKAVQLQGAPCLINIVRDITEQRKAEMEAREQRQQLTHLTRVATLTDYSSTLAHELNQPLAAILSNAQAGLRFLSRGPINVAEMRSILAEIVDADKRAGQIIDRLRYMMKKRDEEFAPLDLNHLVREVLAFVHAEFLVRHVEVTSSFSTDVPHVYGDRVQLQQLVLNLISNACEAMHSQTQRHKVLSITTMQGTEGSAQITVADSGPGITPDQLEKIFEPFYTTKESGLGLGLTICRKIVNAHGGKLLVENRPGEGAVMRVVLPAARTLRRTPMESQVRHA